MNDVREAAERLKEWESKPIGRFEYDFIEDQAFVAHSAIAAGAFVEWNPAAIGELVKAAEAVVKEAQSSGHDSFDMIPRIAALSAALAAVKTKEDA